MKKRDLPVGVYVSDKTKKYRSAINIDKKQKHLGMFETKEEAEEAFLKAKDVRLKELKRIIKCLYCGLKFKKNPETKYQVYCSKFCYKRISKIQCSVKRKKEARERKRTCKACTKPFKYTGAVGNKKYCKKCKGCIESYIKNGFSYSGAYKKIKRLKGC